MTTLQEKLSYAFRVPALLDQALTHKSFANENRALGLKDNERLEFLGDAVLDLALSEILMAQLPDETEGGLSKRRAGLVNEDTLARLAIKLNIPELVKLGKGEDATHGREKPRLIASTLEAIIGSIFLDSGYYEAKAAIEKLFANEVGSNAYERDFKTRLQEYSQKNFASVPVYALLETRGPEHDKEFRVQVSVGSRILGEGIGKTKKQAEQQAAEKALEVLK